MVQTEFCRVKLARNICSLPMDRLLGKFSYVNATTCTSLFALNTRSIYMFIWGNGIQNVFRVRSASTATNHTQSDAAVASANAREPVAAATPDDDASCTPTASVVLSLTVILSFWTIAPRSAACAYSSGNLKLMLNFDNIFIDD